MKLKRHGQKGGKLDIEGILDNVEKFKPLISDHVGWSEEKGQLHPSTIDALIRIGVPRFFLPSGLGGYEITPIECARVTEAIADIDASAAWFVMVFNAARLAGAAWNDEVIEMIFRENPDTLLSASGNSPYQAVEKEDCYQIDGVNHFASGCRHAEWMLSPVRLENELATVLLPMDDCEILDDWDSLGMRGSGSNSVRANQLCVPKNLINFPSSNSPSNNRYYSGLLYRAPARIVFATYVPIAFSLARKSLVLLQDLALEKTPYATNTKLKSRQLAQFHFGKARAIYRAARSFFYEELEKAWMFTKEEREFTEEDKADLYLAGVHAVQECAQVLNLVTNAAGTTVADRKQPLERIRRDMETLRHHGFVNESRYSSVAQVFWGAEIDYPLILR